MSENKQTVERFLGGFSKSDHQQILSCLTDDVEWKVPGMFHLTGKDAFDQEIEHAGRPTINVTRLIEEGDVVVAEGSVRSQWTDGGFLNRAFCDVFVMREAQIQQLTTYLMEIK